MSGARPSRSMTPGRNPSISASALSIRRSTASCPALFLRSTAMLRRPRSSRLKRASLPSRSVSVPTLAARSTRTTSAPMSASSIAQNGAGPMPASSMILTPASGPMFRPFRWRCSTLPQAGRRRYRRRARLETRTAMDSTALRELQAPLKDKYRNDPGAAVVTLKARGDLSDGAIACKVETGRALVEAGLHPATGGSGLEACSGDMLLEALVACAGVTLKAVATAIDFHLRGGSVSAEGDLDFRGTLGVSREAPVGFRDIRLVFELESDEPEDRLQTLMRLT